MDFRSFPLTVVFELYIDEHWSLPPFSGAGVSVLHGSYSSCFFFEMSKFPLFSADFQGYRHPKKRMYHLGSSARKETVDIGGQNDVKPLFFPTLAQNLNALLNVGVGHKLTDPLVPAYVCSYIDDCHKSTIVEPRQTFF